MPNTEVKLTNAESTWTEASREDRKLLIREKTLSNGCLFYIQKGLPILSGPGIAYEHLLKDRSDAQKVVSSMQKPVYERILKERRDAQNSVSNGGADRKLLIKEKDTQ